VAKVSLGAPRHEVRRDAVHEHGAQDVVIFAGDGDGVGAEVQQQLLQQILHVVRGRLRFRAGCGELALEGSQGGARRARHHAERRVPVRLLAHHRQVACLSDGARISSVIFGP
jgi:hypothetical protein